jgi:hypothetical protein
LRRADEISYASGCDFACGLVGCLVEQPEDLVNKY